MSENECIPGQGTVGAEKPGMGHRAGGEALKSRAGAWVGGGSGSLIAVRYLEQGAIKP